MGDFLDAAYRVLTSEQRPRSAQEITKLALRKGWLQSQGKTPSQTMKSKLATDILRRGDRSAFMRTGKNEFALRDWDLDEYVADRFKKALLDEEVMVFPATSLTRYIPGPGLHRHPLRSGYHLAEELTPMLRREAEEDHSVIQLVSVFIIRHDDSLLTYKRTKRLPENRLHGEYSLIFGGHLNPDDIPTLFDLFAPDVGEPFLTRELEEEVRFPHEEHPTISFRGLLYDDSRSLSRQHLGLTYDVITATSAFQIGERGFLIDAKWETLDEIKARLSDFENWSTLLAGLNPAS